MVKIKATGEPLPYNKAGQRNSKSITRIRGIYKAWLKAPSYLLRLETKALRYYLHKNGKELTTVRASAKIFKHGFDNTEVKINFWNKELGLKFYAENY